MTVHAARSKVSTYLRSPNIMDVQHLRYFVEVANRGSVNAAARYLGISQPTLSRQLQRLESYLGVQLFVRENNGVNLTPAGQKMLPAAARALREIDAMLTSVSDAGPTATVRVGLPHSTMHFLLDALLQRAADVGIQLSVVEGANTALSEAVESGRIDVAVLACPPRNPRMHRVALWRENLFLTAARKWRRLPSTMSLQLAASHPLILSNRRDTIRGAIEKAFAAAGLTPKVYLELEGVPTIKHVMHERDLCSLLPWLSIRDELKHETFTASSIRGLWIERHAVVPIGALASPVVAEIFRLLCALPHEKLRNEPLAGVECLPGVTGSSPSIQTQRKAASPVSSTPPENRNTSRDRARSRA